MTLARGLNRLKDALRRHGPRVLAGLALGALRRRGPLGVLRLARGDQPFQSVVRPPARRPVPAWPPMLDADGSVPAQAWNRWLARLPPPPTGEPPDPQAIHLFLEAGDQARPELEAAVGAAFADPRVEVVTFDLCRRRGDRVEPLPAAGANLPMLAEKDLIFSRGAARGAVRAAPGASLRDRILTWARGLTPSEVEARWRHIGRPLLEVAADDAAVARWRRPALEPLPAPPGGGVSVVLCTHDKGHLTRQLMRSLLAMDKARLAEVIVLANNTSSPHGLATLKDLEASPRVRVIRRDEPFNFSRLCNAGVAASRGEGPLLFLNDDIVPVSEDWLGTLLARLADPGVGAVGPLLLYPDERVQHAGIVLRFPTGVGHVLRGARLPQDDPLGLAACAREVSCLTGAVLLVRREAFQAAGGFDEALAISFQDVDLGLKLRRAGWRNVLEPRAVLLHMESVSMGAAATDPDLAMQRYEERALVLERWAALYPRDPFHPAALDPADESGRRLAEP